VSLNGNVASNVAMSSYQWSVGQSAERVVWLHPLGQLNAGANRVRINYTGPENTIVEYIITDNPAVFFIQESHVRR